MKPIVPPLPYALGGESEGIAGCLHNILILKHEGVVCVSISVNTPMLNGLGLSFLFSHNVSLSV